MPDGLISWWAAEGDFSDEMGANHASGIGGIGFTSTPTSQAWLLDGNSGYAKVASPQNLPLGNAPRTLALWIRTPRNLQSSTESALMQYGSNSGGRMFGLITSGNAPGKLYFFGYSSDLAGSTTLMPNIWYHVAVTYDGTTVRLYVNGQPDGSAVRTLNTTLDANGLTIGNRPGNALWQGEIDDTLIFNRALTPEEIAAIHAAGAAAP
jgi:hypothetical protein